MCVCVLFEYICLRAAKRKYFCSTFNDADRAVGRTDLIRAILYPTNTERIKIIWHVKCLMFDICIGFDIFIKQILIKIC